MSGYMFAYLPTACVCMYVCACVCVCARARLCVCRCARACDFIRKFNLLMYNKYN